MDELLNYFIGYSFFIVLIIIFVLSLFIFKIFWKTRNQLSFLFIALSGLSNVIAYLFHLIFASDYGWNNIPYPTITDYLVIFNYVLLAGGIMLYWIPLYSKINGKFPTKWMLISILITAVTATLSLSFFNLTQNLLLDSLYKILPAFTGSMCIPLFFMFKGGNLSKPWLYLTIALLNVLIAEILWTIEFVIFRAVQFSDLFYLTAGILILVWEATLLKSLRT